MSTRQFRFYFLLWLISTVYAQLSFPSLTTDTGAAPTTIPGVEATDGSDPVIPTDSSGFPTATIPPTNLAPFMQKSTLPENFVFIVVGSIIGFFFVGVFTWRVLIAWNIKRNAKRANYPYYGIKKDGMSTLQKLTFGMGGGMGMERAGLMSKPTLPFYKQGLGSEMSLEPLKGKGGGKGFYKDSNRSNLFFSPTAGVGARTASPTASNRGSTYLPAGYYTAGKPATGSPVTAGGRPVSMVDMTNRSNQHFPLPLPKTRRGSPDASPLLRPRGDIGVESTVGRISNVSLDVRAPSAYLEDLFDAPLDDAPAVPQTRRY